MPGELGATPQAASQGVKYELTPKVAASLRRYRISAFVVGVGLLILVLTIVLKYAAGMGWTVALWGPIHGLLYVIYVLLTFDLGYRSSWKLMHILGVLLAGVVPVLSFVIEHWVNKKMLAGERL